MIIATDEELEILRECGHKLAAILDAIKKEVMPGVTTKDLDDLGEKLIKEAGGEPVFKGYKTVESRQPYPCSLCVSINDEIVHAIPSDKRQLKEGDIVGLDIGMRCPRDGGLVTDVAVTVGVGKISPKAEWLIKTTSQALEKGIEVIKPGIHMGDIGSAIQKHLEKSGYGVIRDLAGHGVGHELHEEPLVPNFGRPGTGPRVVEGMVLALEPMAAEGDWRVVLDKDCWTFRTRDNGLAAHFEHTVVVTADGVEVLTQ